MQSIICTFIFYSYGFGLYGKVTPKQALAVALGVYAMQICWSHWWLKRHRIGPLERVWRWMTYGKKKTTWMHHVVHGLSSFSLWKSTASFKCLFNNSSSSWLHWIVSFAEKPYICANSINWRLFFSMRERDIRFTNIFHFRQQHVNSCMYKLLYIFWRKRK